MFERFSKEARHVVVLAQEEARALDHNYIGTEHILLGVLGESEDIGGRVLASFGMILPSVRAEVEEIVGKGKSKPTGHIPFTPRAKKTLELALREALQLKHTYIGTEHILLGLIREGEGVAAQVMRKHADLLEIRTAVLDALPNVPSGEGGEATEESVLQWLRQRLTGGRRTTTAVPFKPAEAPPRGTPAVEEALRQAAAIAGHAPVGSHHLLLAALADTNSAASWALAQLGVDVDELREKLRVAQVAGTSDEKPEQAGRRQMSIQVTDEILTLVLTDPVIVEAGKEALRVANAGAAKAAARAAALRAARETAPSETVEAEAEAIEAQAEAERSARETAATATVIRGDHPAAGNLAQVWTELHKTLTDISGATLQSGAKAEAEAKAGTEAGEGTPEAGDSGAGEGEAASS
jgi:ATP-dependent Clp protease ATP-binding subunit ClpA